MTDITLPRAEVEQALEALLSVKNLEWDEDTHTGRALITTLRERLAQPEQGPVATLLLQSKQNYERNFGPSAAADWIYSDLLELLVTAPPQQEPVFDCPRCGHCCPQRQWVGLTDEEIEACRQQGYANGGLNAAFDFDKAAGELLAKAKEKNT